MPEDKCSRGISARWPVACRGSKARRRHSASASASTCRPPWRRSDATKPAGGPFLPVAGLAALPSLRPIRRRRRPDLLRLEAQIERCSNRCSIGWRTPRPNGDREHGVPVPTPRRGPGCAREFKVRRAARPVHRPPGATHRTRHSGPHGTPILASGGGRVVSAGYKGAYGRAVVIDHGDGLSTLYGHASKLLVRAGDVVMPNQQIALVGSTGDRPGRTSTSR